MITDSIFIQWFTRVIAFIRNSVLSSFFFLSVNKFFDILKTLWIKSWFYSILAKSSKIDEAFSHSFLAESIDKFLNILKKFGTTIGNSFMETNKSGINYRLYSFAKPVLRPFKFHVLLGIAIALMFVVPGEIWNNLYAVILLAPFFMLFFIQLFLGFDYGFSVKELPLSFVSFVFAVAVSLFFTGDLGDSVRVLIFYIAAFSFCLLIYGAVRDGKSLQTFLGFIFAAVILTSFYAVYQNSMGIEVDLTLTDMNVNSNMSARIYSTFANPNNYAEFLALLYPFCLAFALNLKNKLYKAVSLLLMILPVIAIGLTFARAGWISFAIMIFIFFMLYDKRLLILLGIAALCALPFLPSSITGRIASIGNTADTSANYRLYIWEGAFKLWVSNFFTGIGIGPNTFLMNYQSFARSNAVQAMHSHITYLQIFIETGLLGGISFVLLQFKLIKNSFFSISKAGPQTRNILIASASSLVGIIFVSCVEYIWFYPRVLFTFWIVIGITLSAIKAASSKA